MSNGDEWSGSEPVQLEPIVAYKLSSMRLIKLDNNKSLPSCQLYRQYFQPMFLTAAS
ncbi:AAA-like domain-containing protein [Scytonema sp. HK-05]|uniref:AAA-like domain-containing protein n=1 Tax=Scytonema sp. HK-05 TaxID=1137095 RepID=UPI000A4AF851|nr:AAA-like domain-containing protein [Scytonema sp. HK-05]